MNPSRARHIILRADHLNDGRLYEIAFYLNCLGPIMTADLANADGTVTSGELPLDSGLVAEMRDALWEVGRAIADLKKGEKV